MWPLEMWSHAVTNDQNEVCTDSRVVFTNEGRVVSAAERDLPSTRKKGEKKESFVPHGPSTHTRAPLITTRLPNARSGDPRTSVGHATCAPDSGSLLPRMTAPELQTEILTESMPARAFFFSFSERSLNRDGAKSGEVWRRGRHTQVRQITYGPLWLKDH